MNTSGVYFSCTRSVLLMTDGSNKIIVGLGGKGKKQEQKKREKKWGRRQVPAPFALPLSPFLLNTSPYEHSITFQRRGLQRNIWCKSCKGALGEAFPHRKNFTKGAVGEDIRSRNYKASS